MALKKITNKIYLDKMALMATKVYLSMALKKITLKIDIEKIALNGHQNRPRENHPL